MRKFFFIRKTKTLALFWVALRGEGFSKARNAMLPLKPQCSNLLCTAIPQWKTVRIFLWLFIFFLLTACQTNQGKRSSEVGLQLSVAYWLEKTEKQNQADQLYKTLIKKYPSIPSVHNNYGAFLCQKGDYRKGIKQLLIAAKTKNYSRSDDSYRNAAECALSAQDEVLASELLRQGREKRRKEKKAGK